jgi:hypothetical protein
MSDELAVQQVLAHYVREHDRRDGAAMAALYLINFVNGFFVIYGLPYLNKEGGLEHGDWVSAPDLTEEGKLNPPKSHQASFRGGRPHDGKGRELRMGTVAATTHVAEGFDTNITFSYKLKDGDVMRDYRSFEEKVLTYLDTITAPAMAKYPEATPLKAIEKMAIHPPSERPEGYVRLVEGHGAEGSAV